MKLIRQQAVTAASKEQPALNIPSGIEVGEASIQNLLEETENNNGDHEPKSSNFISTKIEATEDSTSSARKTEPQLEFREIVGKNRPALSGTADSNEKIRDSEVHEPKPPNCIAGTTETTRDSTSSSVFEARSTGEVSTSSTDPYGFMLTRKWSNNPFSPIRKRISTSPTDGTDSYETHATTKKLKSRPRLSNVVVLSSEEESSSSLGNEFWKTDPFKKTIHERRHDEIHGILARVRSTQLNDSGLLVQIQTILNRLMAVTSELAKRCEKEKENTEQK